MFAIITLLLSPFAIYFQVNLVHLILKNANFTRETEQILRRPVLTFAAALAAVLLSAAPAAGRSVSLYNSLKGFGGTLLLPSKTDDTQVLALTFYADTYGVLAGKYVKPGAKFNISRFGTVGSGDRLTFFAGPGFSAGYVRDFDREDFDFDAKNASVHGPMAALSATAGIRLAFDRAVSLGFSLTAEAGILVHKDADTSAKILAAYKNGLMRTVYPELSIILAL